MKRKVSKTKRTARRPRVYMAVIEKCAETGLYVGYVPGLAGCHSQGSTLDELNRNLQEVLGMLIEDGVPVLASEVVGLQPLVA
jgi:predicted RNase H-like HicB family nuclease